MSKIHIDRLIKRFNLKPSAKGWSGLPYRQLMTQVINENTQHVARRMVEESRRGWDKALSKISTEEKRFILPDVSEALPQRSVFMRKAAQKGKLISDTLRDSLTANLRDTLNQFTPVTQEATFIRRRGAKAGTINPKLISQFEAKITKTFENYTRRDKDLGVPKNVHAIAVTEMRATINDTKHQYALKLQEQNPDLRLRKRWIHNMSLSKLARRGHVMVARRAPIGLDEYFEVPNYKEAGGRFYFAGSTRMLHPHDPNAPAGQVIGCNCDLELLASKKRK